MPVNNVNNVNNTHGLANNVNAGRAKTDLSVNDFLRIMAAELQNQNPMGGESGGGSKTDYLGQLAQFTMLEQMNIMGDSINQLAMLNQVNLIGKEVTIYTGEEEDLAGKVDKVKYFNSTVYLEVNGKDYPIGLLMEIRGDGVPPTTRPKPPEEDDDTPPVEEPDEVIDEEDLNNDMSRINTQAASESYTQNRRRDLLEE